jgi:cytochrome c oxidase subunit I+III
MTNDSRPTGESYFSVDAERHRDFQRTWSAARPPLAWFREVNNIPIALRYIGASFAFLFAGGLMALLLRIQLAVPENGFLDPETYNQLFTMHGTTMMFLFVIPFIEALANYFLPLLLGTRDLPFPRFTTLAFWTFLWGGLLVYSSFLFGVAPDGGWFAYVPLTNRTYSPGIGMDFWDIGLSVAEIAAMGAAAELIVAILRMRAPGQALHQLPIFAWAMLVFAFMVIFAFTPLIVGTALLEFDRKGLTSFFEVAAGGEPLLWQHLFWIFGHPEVYIMFIPAIGLVSQMLPVFARRPLVGYPLVVLSLIATGFLSFGLWVHHMFTTGLSPTSMGFFAAVSLLIAIPTGVQMIAWIATIWKGRPVWRTPLMFIAGFLIIFVMGGVTGTMVGAVPYDYQVHDTYFVVAHFHYVLIGGVVFPFFATAYYWLPKITGRLLSETLGKWNFWLMFVFFHLTFFPMHIAGLLGMPRRIYTYEAGLGWDTYNLISSIGAWGFGLGATLLLVNLVWSIKRGRPAGANPWNADTLEWWEPSPPPDAQFEFLPFVRSRHPLWEQESLAPETEAEARQIEPMRGAPRSWRGALIVSVLDGKPLAISWMPGPTLWPVIMSLAFLATFVGLLVENMWLVGGGLTVIIGGVIAWFWPNASQERAMAEIGTPEDENTLPLALAGPQSNGYWAMWIFLLVMAVAFATIVASYFYLSKGPATWPPVMPDAGGMARWATVAAVALAATTYWMARSMRRQQAWSWRLGTAASLALTIALGFTSFVAWQELGLRAVESAYASIFAATLSFNWVLLVLLFLMLTFTLVWAIVRPADIRGHGLAWLTELQGYFAAACWVLTFAVLYLTPYLW